MKALWYRSRLRFDLLKQRPFFWAAVLGIGLVVAALASAANGALPMTLAELAHASVDIDDPRHTALWSVRFPRVVGGALVGAALGVGGALMQTVVRNPLADPGLIGVTAGAGVAALLGIIFFPEHVAWLPAIAFTGGLLAVTLLLGLSWSQARSTGPLRIVLSGVALQAIFFAGIALLTFFYADRAPAFVAFIVGSLNGVGWSDVSIVSVPTLLGITLALGSLRALDMLLLDDATAGGLGLAVRGARLGTSCMSALLTAGAVSVAGLVAFVGLVVPNGVRLLVGPAHASLIPLTALGGATLVVAADALARTSAAPLELPVGALLAVVGGPYFLFILWRKLP